MDGFYIDKFVISIKYKYSSSPIYPSKEYDSISQLLLSSLGKHSYLFKYYTAITEYTNPLPLPLPLTLSTAEAIQYKEYSGVYCDISLV
jgi:hypothetical protein